MAKKHGFGDDQVSTSTGMAIAAACKLVYDIKGEGAIYRGWSPGSIFDLDQLLRSGLFDEDEDSGMLINKGNSEVSEDFEIMRHFKPLRGMGLVSARNLYRSIKVKFRRFTVSVKLRGTRRENSIIVDWWVCAMCFVGCCSLTEHLSADPETISPN